MVFCGSFSYLKERLKEIVSAINPQEKTAIVIHTNKMKFFLKEHLTSHLGIISNIKFYTLIDISKLITEIEPIQDFEKNIILKKILFEKGYENLDGFAQEIGDIIQHIKEFEIDIDTLNIDWLKDVVQDYEIKKSGYFDREDVHLLAINKQTNIHFDNMIIFGFRSVVPLHRKVFAKLHNMSNNFHVFLPFITKSGYYENYTEFRNVRDFFESLSNCVIEEDEKSFDSNINIGRYIYRFDYDFSKFSCENIKIFSAFDEEEEIKIVATLISDLVINGVKFYEIGVVIPVIENYISVIKEIFPRYYIPYYLTQDNRLIDKQFYKNLFNLFLIKQKNFSREPVENFLSPCIVDIKNREELIDSIRIFSNFHSYEEWEKFILQKYDVCVLKEILQLLNKLPEKGSLEVYLRVFRQISDKLLPEGKDFLNTIFDTMESHHLYTNLLKDITYDEFVSIVRTFFHQEHRDSRIKSETVQILTPNSAQGNNFKYLFILNLNSGVFPSVSQHLSDIGRRDYMLMQQLSNFSTLLDREKKIYLSFLNSSPKSKTVAPSFLITEIQRVADISFENPAIKGIQSYPLIKDSQVKEPSTGDYVYDFVNHDFPVKATTFSTYAICPYRYFFDHVVGITSNKNQDRKSIPPNRVGVFVHEVLKDFYFHLDLDDPVKYLENQKLKIKEKFNKFLDDELVYIFPSYQPFVYADILSLMENIFEFLEKDISLMESTKREVLKEFLEKDVVGIHFKGKIDRIDKDNSGYYLYDYKVTKKADRDLKDMLSEEFIQLPVYKTILEKTGIVKNGDIKSLGVIFLRDDKGKFFYEIDSPDGVKYIIERYKDIFKNFKQKIFNPKSSNHCDYCNYNDFCSRGKEG